MKITVELPDWVDERHLYILAGIEMVAFNLYGERKWHVKTGRCNMCGKCCNVPIGNHFPFPRNGAGDCIYLRKSEEGDYGECTLGVQRPWICCTDLTQEKRGRPYCTVSYEVMT